MSHCQGEEAIDGEKSKILWKTYLKMEHLSQIEVDLALLTQNDTHLGFKKKKKKKVVRRKNMMRAEMRNKLFFLFGLKLYQYPKGKDELIKFWLCWDLI